MSFNQYQPYGPVVETTMRIVTWNVWGRYGNWREREAGIEETLVTAAPDVVCLVECWSRRAGLRAGLLTLPALALLAASAPARHHANPASSP